MIYVIIFCIQKKQRCNTHTVYYTAVFVICKYDFLDNPVNFCLFCAFFSTISKKYSLFRRFTVKDFPNCLAKKDALCIKCLSCKGGEPVVYDEIIGGDVTDTAANGVVRGFKMPKPNTTLPTGTEPTGTTPTE